MPGGAHPGDMLTITHPGTTSADELAALFTGIRQLDDAVDALTQARIELSRLIADSHWQSEAVEMLRASLGRRADDVDSRCTSVETQRDLCLRGIA